MGEAVKWFPLIGSHHTMAIRLQRNSKRDHDLDSLPCHLSGKGDSPTACS